MHQISIILNEVKGQFDNVIVVIHASQNLYDIASMNSVLLDADVRQSDMLFDASLFANVDVNLLSNGNH